MESMTTLLKIITTVFAENEPQCTYKVGLSMIASIIVATVVICFQLGVFKRIVKNLSKFKDLSSGNGDIYFIVSPKNTSESEDEGSEKTDMTNIKKEKIEFGSTTDSDFYNKIVVPLNDYIKKCSFLTVYAIENFVSNEITKYEDKVSNYMSIPVLSGLAGTVLGILMSLPQVPYLVDDSCKIYDFIPGMAVAMSTTFLGLCVTIYFHLKFNSAQRDVENAKNKFMFFVAGSVDFSNSELAPLFETMAKNMNEFNNGFSENIASFSHAVGDIKTLGERQSEIVEALNKIGINDIAEIAKSNMAIMEEFVTLSAKVEGILEQFAGISNSVETVQSLNESLKQNITETNNYIVKTLDGTEKLFAEFRNQLSGATSEILASLGNNVNKVLNEAVDETIRPINDMKGMIEKLTESSQKNIKDSLNGTMDIITTAANNMKNMMEKLTESSQKSIKDSLEGTTDNITTAANDMKNMIEKSTDLKERMDKMAAELNKVSEFILRKSPIEDGETIVLGSADMTSKK